MRIVAGCFLLVATALIPPQSSSDFHTLYGKSDEGRFLVRPDVYLTVQYADDEMASEMEISPVPVALDSKVAKAVFPHLNLSEAQTIELIDELAPPSLRSSLIRDNDGHGWGDTEEYENVTIQRHNTGCPDAPQTVRPIMECIQSVGIVFKRDGAMGAGGSKSEVEYRARYGKSDMERFMVRPEIGLTVEYSSDGTACQLTSAVAEPLVSNTGPRVLNMTETVATEIENELAPPASRGAKLPRSGGFQSGVAYTVGEEYASVNISRAAFVCNQPEKCIVSSTIQLKKKQCTALIQRTGTPPGLFSSAGTAR
jgi:hypothetical protein